MKNKKIRVGIDVDNVVLGFTGRFIDCFFKKQPYNNQTIYPTFNDLYDAYEYILEQEGFLINI